MGTRSGPRTNLGVMTMTHALRFQTLRPSVRCRLACWVGAGMSLALAIGTVSASVPTSDDLGVRFKILRAGPTATVEIRMTPRRDFDAVTVEAASGVASLTPSCVFANVKVVAGGSYVCRVDVTGKPSEAAMTLNVVARRAVPGGTVPVMEVHHLSVKNSAFAVSQKSAAASHHDVADAAAIQK
jgi:hypothetical protein